MKKNLIIRKIARLLKKPLARRSVYIDRMVEPHHLFNFAKKLRPVKTKFQLIRIGGATDGGYLLPDDLDDINACFSPGVADTATFETELMKLKGINSHLADFSVDKPPMNFKPLSFTKKFIGTVNDEMYITMDQWVSEQTKHNIEQDLILQMDIEGWEYPSLLSLSETILKRFRIIVIEIHAIESWGNSAFFNIAEAFFSRILQYFHVVHNHPNNFCGVINMGGFEAPNVFELTLLRKDRSPAMGYCDEFPHPLDAPNVKTHKDLHLSKNWYQFL